ncbi:FAD/NAD(P)-binding domain-containing protein [Guyanagaster necrorhizus]|uniref:FAD/NAD(P)-binding domain-containing protein n=1 Tax=Guyanagaster necrorhizus TaxID=856835 RepID=A0A9P7VW98_9AGAR|nr:FAD/NAD(P)-binding domain-containing protein [Guyanagaster necrorhizus MCA 3950]KAG7448696.1 FAD/NAD(P)-binding domain-containing protein [Guyanagaster necrorhizus MCA 3950]
MMNHAHKRICIIGAGPSGLAVLKVILDTEEFKTGIWLPTVFEARDKIGGVWYPALPTDSPPLTPLYDSMTTNIPHPVMAYTSFPFPPSTPVFPPAATVETYLHDYAAHFHLIQNIRLNARVEHVEWNHAANCWHVLVQGETLDFDLVVVSNGHFRVPRYPDIPGLAEWLENGKASHSAWYRNSQSIGDACTVAVVGSGPSGVDIAAELLASGVKVVYSVNDCIPETTATFRKRGAITHFGDGITFVDGTIERNVDHCILATGYQMCCPFFSPATLQNESPPLLPSNLYNSSYHLFPLGKHIFPLRGDFLHTSLAFTGLILRGTPFSLFEAQAYAIVRVFRDPKSLDEDKEMAELLERQLMVPAKDWHRPTEAEAFDYRDGLYEFGGMSMRVEPWEKRMWEYKVELRREWMKLVRSGEAFSSVQGIGQNGSHEWVALLESILQGAN